MDYRRKQLELGRLNRFLFVAAALALFAIPSAAGNAPTSPCSGVKITNAVVGTAAVVVPNNTPGPYKDSWGNLVTITASGQVGSRRLVTYCVSKNASNAAGALVTIRADGTVPTTAVTDPGVVLAQSTGDCVSFLNPGSIAPQAISTLASTYLVIYECY